MSTPKKLRNYINGTWQVSSASDYVDVVNPATAEILGFVPFSQSADVDKAVQAASSAFNAWRRTPVEDRIQPLFRLKALLDEHAEELARLITIENGKTFNESMGEMKRAIENVEVSCGMPMLIQGSLNEDIASGIDELMIRQPVGVVAIISPFNFPSMIPFWFLPHAIAAGNPVVLKPSERTPMTMNRVMDIIEEAGFPKGVINLVNGGADAVNALLDHPKVRAISFVGSTNVARHVYSRGAANGKRVQAQGGAKNSTVVMPDADLEMTAKIVLDSAFGNAGQRCLANAMLILVGEDLKKNFAPMLVEKVQAIKIGYGLDESVGMGPVITPASKARIEGLIATGVDEGAALLVDGRDASVDGFAQGNFLRPTILDNVPPTGTIFKTEIFGPVLGLMYAETLDKAIGMVNASNYGNMSCLFTGSGASARQFRYEIQAGNVGINIGVAAPMAFFPFSGWKDSFFGTLHAQAKHSMEFYTQTKIVVERWPKEWSRQF
ncbi:MAG: CoA-acylating methylmalonate-semialdehyde dehydrogenase [Anaerolineales bacterium]|nr:CoA-acylating methylmalonate-semialdehyde dehydrogenase [Anaerolineales bacterium]